MKPKMLIKVENVIFIPKSEKHSKHGFYLKGQSDLLTDSQIIELIQSHEGTSNSYPFYHRLQQIKSLFYIQQIKRVEDSLWNMNACWDHNKLDRLYPFNVDTEATLNEVQVWREGLEWERPETEMLCELIQQKATTINELFASYGIMVDCKATEKQNDSEAIIPFTKANNANITNIGILRAIAIELTAILGFGVSIDYDLLEDVKGLTVYVQPLNYQ